MLGYADHFGVRGAQLDETIRVWRHLWSTPEKEFQGDFYNLPSTAFGPLPFQDGGSSGAARRRVGHVGAAWHPVGVSADDILQLKPMVEDAASAAKRPMPKIASRPR